VEAEIEEICFLPILFHTDHRALVVLVCGVTVQRDMNGVKGWPDTICWPMECTYM
jgi:hypothetical protein